MEGVGPRLFCKARVGLLFKGTLKGTRKGPFKDPLEEPFKGFGEGLPAAMAVGLGFNG